MTVRAFKKCGTTTEEDGSENHLVHIVGINYKPQPEEEFHHKTLSNEDIVNSFSTYDVMSSSDEDNEPTPQS